MISPLRASRVVALILPMWGGLGCARVDCRTELQKLVGEVPGSVSVSHCTFNRGSLDVRNFKLNAALESRMGFGDIASALQLKSDNLSEREAVYLGGWGEYTSVVLNRAFTDPRGAIRVENGYLIILKEGRRAGEFELSVFGQQGFSKE